MCRTKLLAGRGLVLLLGCVLLGAIGCGRSRTQVVEEEPDPTAQAQAQVPEQESAMRWTIRKVNYEDRRPVPTGDKAAAGTAPAPAAPRAEDRPVDRMDEAARKQAEPLSKDAKAPPPAPRPHPKQAPTAAPARPQPDSNGGQLQGQPPREGRDGKDQDSYRRGLDDQTLKLRNITGGGQSAAQKGKEAAPAGKPGQKSPQVWKRDHQRPTFARVYVGNGNSLELISLQVTTTIEGPRARTVVDHIFRNPHDRRLEGTFEYPLPSGASPSFFAMFLGQTRDTVPPRFARRGEQPALPADALALLTPAELVKHVDTADWGTLQQARVVSKERALETYEDIVRGQIDPALLEYAGGNTFSGRVFPIPAKGYNRVIIAYEELLPVSQARALYRFPLPDCKLTELQYTLNASAEECKEPTFKPDDTKKAEAGSRLAYHRTWKDNGPGGDVVFAYTPPRPHIQVISGRQVEGGAVHVYARVRPELKVKADRPFASHAVFLLDTSLSEHPDRFALNMKLMKKILEGDSAVRQFNILAFNVGTAWIEPKGWLQNTPSGREQALGRLDGVVLEGATDLSAALERLAQPGFDVPANLPVNIFLLSDGQITWGEPEVGPLVSRFEQRCGFSTRFHCYHTGLTADNLELFEALTRKGGGVFNCFTEADLPAAALAHRHECLQVERVRLVGGPAAGEILVAGRKAAVYPGGELIVAAKLAGTGKTQLVIEGTFLGEKYSEEYAVDATGVGELAPRGWAEIAVASLLALNDPRLDSLITAYCQQFGVGSRVASFLVLENEADYKRLNLEAERGKTVPCGDVGRFLDEMWKGLGKALPPKEAFERFLARIEPRVKLLSGEQGAHVKKLLSLLNDKDFEIVAEAIRGALLRRSDVPADYLKAMEADRRNVETYLVEARRRADAQDADGAVRTLSSVIEEYPARADALRLVGYRLLDLKQPAQAVRLFQQVQRNRPFEPHSYRDLARSLEESGKFGLAAVQYEIVLAGTWHNRFRESLKIVAREEYARMMQAAIRRKAVSPQLMDHFGERLERMTTPQPKSDLRVTISWNTDATDVDLWVVEPDGTRCFYQHNRTKNGGELSEDQTQGYGPERYQIKNAPPGEFTVIVHYFSPNNTLLGGETHVNVAIARNAGTPQEVVERRTVILKQRNDQIEVAKIKF
jgi:tetratricopeptide (TPR) repeat protein